MSSRPVPISLGAVHSAGEPTDQPRPCLRGPPEGCWPSWWSDPEPWTAHGLEQVGGWLLRQRGEPQPNDVAVSWQGQARSRGSWHRWTWLHPVLARSPSGGSPQQAG